LVLTFNEEGKPHVCMESSYLCGVEWPEYTEPVMKIRFNDSVRICGEEIEEKYADKVKFISEKYESLDL
jgi:hypothetical protein